MTRQLNPILIVIFTITTWACQNDQSTADLVIYNGNIYTSSDNEPMIEAVAVIADTIAFTGTKEEVKEWISDSTQILDLQGKTMTAGFIEGHAHLMGIGNNLLNLDLSKTTSYDDLVKMVEQKVANSQPGDWILGRGWHQDKWIDQPEQLFGGFPSHHLLSKVSPNNPVFLNHASGHAAIANAKAMEIAGLVKETISPEGGEIFKDLSGNPTGVLNETAMDLIWDFIPKESPERKAQALQLALDECLKNGITSFHDAGADSSEIALYKEFGQANKLNIRLYVMLNGANKNLIKAYSDYGIEKDLYNQHLTIRAIKLYADGALGSRGALLLEDYSDAPGVHGHRIQSLDYIKEITELGYQGGFQICTHCIGDRANKEILDLYEEIYGGKHTDLRFRIEHAQHIHPLDIPRFGKLGVIPSMQAIHMSSDRPWAIDRLGKKRIIDGAYMWNSLTQTGATIVNGTDAPVEPLNPIACFFAAVTRQTLKGTPEGGYEAAEKMTRQEALKSYTINNAYGAFEEDMKGSIEVGKLADFTIFSQDIMKVPDTDILKTKVNYTVIRGKVVYRREIE